jgi:glycosyltransferase involved in cell wall biosynthesis
VRVSVLSHDLSSNALGRAHVLAELLNRNFDVEVAGPQLNGNIWAPIADERSYIELNITEDLPSYTRNARNATERLNGDIVVAVKPRATSFGIGLLKRYLDDVPLVLDIDDWETGGAYESSTRLREHLRAIPHMYYVNSLNHTYGLEKFSTVADARIVSNTFLQSRFGGTLIPHARDTEKFDPGVYKKSAVRSELGLPQEKTIVMFSGTPRPHKGVGDLITAVNSLDAPDIIAAIVGANDTEYVSKLKRQAGEKIEFFGQQPFDELPKWISAADVYVIPQKQTAANRGQLPAKVFDAMAMAKPVIATDISDLPLVLDDCGLIVDSDSPDQIAEKILYLHENPDECEVIGSAARERCVDRYSYNALAPKLAQAIHQANLQ